MSRQKHERTVIISNDNLEADLVIPPNAQAIILFAHGTGSSRHSNRNHYVAKVLNDAGFATLLVDLLTPQEKKTDELSRHMRFDVELLAKRFICVTGWVMQDPATNRLKVGYFGSSTGAAAALAAAAKMPNIVKAVVSRGGRPDLATPRDLLTVRAPTLFIVGGKDDSIIMLNRSALNQLSQVDHKELAIIPDAGHIFEEPGKMEEVAMIATEWFESYLLQNGKRFQNNYRRRVSSLSSIIKHSVLRIVFKDRAAAGEMLASSLRTYYDKGDDRVTVIGIARGGVPIADEIAKKLQIDFDIVVPRKLRAPSNSENAIGSIMQDGSTYLQDKLIESIGISKEYLELEKLAQLDEIHRRMKIYRPERREYNINGRTVILVDDGAASGATMNIAARWVRGQGSRKLIVALPIASKHAAELLRNEVEHIETLMVPPNFGSVEEFYRDYEDVTDEQVIRIMKRQHSIDI